MTAELRAGPASGTIRSPVPEVTFDHGIFVTQRFGGVSRYFVELARALARAGVPVTVRSPIFVTDAVETLRREGVAVRGRLVPAFKGATWLGNQLGRLASSRSAPGLVHETWYMDSVGKRCPGRIAVTLHDMISELFPDEVTGGLEQSRRKRAAVKRADLIFCVSETTRRDAAELLGIPADRMVVTPLASSLSVLPRSQSARPFLLYVGHRGGYKNFRLLLSAYGSRPRLHGEFDLVCFGGPPLDASERELVPRAGKVVHLVGGDDVLEQLYAQASVLVCTSRYEGFGLPLLEAMSAGCPVVAVGGGSTPEVGGSAARYVQADDIDELADTLESLLSDEAELEAMSARGVLRSANFSWSRTASRTLEAYAERQS
ncbi:Glycosyltransferase involved in cell wall bisynthesis [Luteibacter sp. UNCMF331Sha3.1]|uniref:glycosyltransferase family 4 protein n=1 Tax=Luteibacter sp. UNCMF331Sha3.1 TaxID=1502760 RepID=UPI0008C88543|nr:glycosyltransferase family 1 protein [Luteibacter sp. UNCMF331Sha3.1]SEM92476.1 Glycosyltransferase involved in cell wall bisynthesis [Luteibacter sp. UNCMF331Sha3.1]